MTLTPDEQRLIDLFRKAKRRRLTLHVVCHEAVARMYLAREEEAVTVGTSVRDYVREHSETTEPEPYIARSRIGSCT